MGGAATEISAGTTDLLIEGAHFDPVSVARTSRRHKLPSEAAKRFERGVDPLLQRVAVRRCAELITAYGGGEISEVLTDAGGGFAPVTITLPLDLPERVVGVAYTHDEVLGTLRELGCELGPVREQGGAQVVDATVPSWRPDLLVPVDLVEEVARLRGYDRIDSVLPAAPAGRGLTFGQRMRRRVADALADAGFVETLSYPFVGEAELDALGLPADDERRRAVRLVNPLAETQPSMRTSLLLTLLATARRNVSRGAGDLAVFEVGLVTVADAKPAPAPTGGVYPGDEVLAQIEAAVPSQPRHVAGVLAGRREPAGWWGPGRRCRPHRCRSRPCSWSREPSGRRSRSAPPTSCRGTRVAAPRCCSATRWSATPASCTRPWWRGWTCRRGRWPSRSTWTRWSRRCPTRRGRPCRCPPSRSPRRTWRSSSTRR